MPKAPPFTAESARAAALKSHAPNSARFAHAVQPNAQPQSTIAVTPQPARDDFNHRRLARVRKQLAMLDTAIETELQSDKPDAAKLDRFASASAKLSELVRVLAGVPLPGSHRPSRPARQSPGSSSVVPE